MSGRSQLVGLEAYPTRSLRSFASQEGGGDTFSVSEADVQTAHSRRQSLVLVSQSSSVSAADARIREGAIHSEIRVALVDDEPANQRIACRFLKGIGVKRENTAILCDGTRVTMVAVTKVFAEMCKVYPMCPRGASAAVNERYLAASDFRVGPD